MALATPQADQIALEPVADSRRPATTSIALWCAIGLLAAAGCLGIERELTLLWRCWTTDPLRSIGMLIPPASIILTLRVWRQNGWQLRGSWWGLALIGAAFFVSILHQSAELFFTAGTALVSLIPLTLPVYLYGSGIVLLFAGARVWRKAWFPLGLLLLSQPVPVLTSSMIDIPLQNISARVAREFATLIHFAPTTPQLRLMFSPDFGMFIAPGCDGIRGAVTLGYLALILGYLKRVTLRRWVAYVVGGVLLGYFFNFIRLCVLVVYYRIALGHPALEDVAKQADYVIGSCLFLLAILIFIRLASLKAEPASAGSRATPAKCPGPAPIVPGARNRRRQRAINSSAAPHLPSSCSPFSLCLHPRYDRGKARRPQPCRRLHPSPASQNKSAASRSRAPGTSSQADKRSSKAEPTPRLVQTRSSSPSGLRRSSTTTTPLLAGWRAAFSPSASLPCPSSQPKANPSISAQAFITTASPTASSSASHALRAPARNRNRSPQRDTSAFSFSSRRSANSRPERRIQFPS